MTVWSLISGQDYHHSYVVAVFTTRELVIDAMTALAKHRHLYDVPHHVWTLTWSGDRITDTTPEWTNGFEYLRIQETKYYDGVTEKFTASSFNG